MTGKQTLLQQQRLARVWLRWLAGGCLLFALAACDRPRAGQTTAEQDEPHFRRGMKLLSTNKPAALEAFQKVIDQRGGDAPESHFEAGRIQLDHFKDHVAAIYHFNRYLHLRPNGTYSAQVQQMIDTAKREYSRKLAQSGFPAQDDRLDLIDQRDKLQAEVIALRAELDRLKRGGRGGAVASGNDPAAVANNNRGAAPPVAPAPTPSTGWSDAVSDAAPAPNVAPVLPESATTQASTVPSGSGRTYTVRKGDTLVAISRQLYGSATQWRAIFEANRDQLPDPNGLKVGMVLRLP